MTTMHCPHACPSPCSTCENSEAAKELRALRRVVDAVQRLEWYRRGDGGWDFVIPRYGETNALHAALADVPHKRADGSEP